MSRLTDDQMIPAIEWFAEQMPGGFFVYRADDTQEILYVNQATWRIFGCESLEDFKELTGNTFKGMVHPEDRDKVQTSIDDQIADASNNNLDYVVYRVIRKDGSIRWVDDYGHYTDLPGYGNVFYVFIGDITEKKTAQEQQEKNEMLALALREAERANVAKTAFLSNMSHEIRTPMNAIIGLDNIALKNPELSSETRDQLKKIGASARHLLSLINDILDMSRIESGRMTIRNEEFSVGNMLEQINTMIEAQCDDAKLEYICRINGHLDDYYTGDDMKLKQVVINILGNAVKFTPAPGTVTFTVEEISRDDKNAVLRFSMKDTGVGMDKEYLPKIFDAFSQENEGSSNKYGSTGLGMAITKNIVDMMQGTITVNSEKGVGSEFIVTVTLGLSAKSNAETKIDDDSIKALVIDDDITACEHAKLVLGKKGIEVDYCLDGEEALKQFGDKKEAGETYDLLLIDWKMPKLDGVEVIRRFRKTFKDDRTVLLLTTYNWDEIVDEALEAGVDGFLPKPFFAKSVLEQYKTVMTGWRKESEKEPEHKASLKGRHILLAEDVMINAEIMKQLLRMKEMDCDHAENGKLAVELFEKNGENAYDAILMDIKMPEMNGLEATKAIRAMTRADAAKVPIIALTANAFDEDVQQSLDAGMVAHLTKPIEPDALYSTLESLIEG